MRKSDPTSFYSDVLATACFSFHKGCQRISVRSVMDPGSTSSDFSTGASQPGAVKLPGDPEDSADLLYYLSHEGSTIVGSYALPSEPIGRDNVPLGSTFDHPLALHRSAG
uniref:Uncharacterized protein n=1 Tax=Sphaerodactylus townsendi TaxID=933632 RepID=A0ACB8GBZ3_9SAUR